MRNDGSDWESLAAALKKQGHRILPQTAGGYPYHDESLYRQALKGELVQADLLVQLLGGFSGRKPSWADELFVHIQANAAKAEAQRRTIPLLAWRGPDIVPEASKDPAYQALLVSAADWEFDAFCKEVIGRLSIPIPMPSAAPLSVLINADTPDRDLGKQAQDILFDAFEVEATLAAQPLLGQKSEDYFQHMKTQLVCSQGVLIIYGKAPPSWVQAQKAEATKVLSGLRKGIWGAVLDGPPDPKPDHGIKSRNLIVLDCRRGLSPAPLKSFVDSLRKETSRV